MNIPNCVRLGFAWNVDRLDIAKNVPAKAKRELDKKDLLDMHDRKKNKILSFYHAYQANPSYQALLHIPFSIFTIPFFA